MEPLENKDKASLRGTARVVAQARERRKRRRRSTAGWCVNCEVRTGGKENHGKKTKQMVALFLVLPLVKVALDSIFDLRHWQKMSVLIQEGSFEKRH